MTKFSNIVTLFALLVAAASVLASSCPGNCSGNGVCDEVTGVCHCSPAYDGLDCSTLKNETQPSFPEPSDEENVPDSHEELLPPPEPVSVIHVTL